MIREIRERALAAERHAQAAASPATRERARGRSDAASWWYARHVELLIGRPDVIAALVREAEGIAAAEVERGNVGRANGRRAVDAWVQRGFKRRWEVERRLHAARDADPASPSGGERTSRPP